VGVKSADVQTFISKELHTPLFLEEFVFCRNKFSPLSSSEVEFADAVVMLGDVLLIFQIKERSTRQASSAQGERRWFQSKVIGRATKQIRDTLGFLRTNAEIRVPNERGHVFNLSVRAFADVIKIVVYMPSANLPKDCRRIRHHVSGSAGFIHIVDARDYVELSRTLRVPQEVIRYFKYRESVLTRFTEGDANPSEAAIAGHFVGGNPDVAPTNQSVSYLHRLIQDDAEWDLAPLI
jgi:hypothetical protein